jgi:uncharacterized protein (TIGR03435 family)
MTVGQRGPKFKDSTPKGQPKDDGAPGPMKRDSDGFPILTPGASMAIVPGHARMRSDDQTVAWFAERLSEQLQAPVTDATGLTGKYDFLVSWTREEGPLAASATAADLINAVQLQLGLELEHKKGPVELAVDHMEKTPTEN